ncbi:nitrogen permease regulator Npr2 [Talaromyces proteolyticus]|uniref:Nitrogen permease regulator Npr2 n=1 Tax=Talaromyces proteolyticus TaxID=1131652 RepID=A0AAD4KTC4_9EURO|nr:nitrogen permease regulator Npr2 [Talaromyces proteolyticus]KAH8700543.1 nitrogen permease regulator Npr2 [Talaromyces proteolyticus]
MIKAIFYSKFDTQEGPKVVHQVPDGAIVPSAAAAAQQTPLFTFSDISFFVIPRQELCGNLLQVCIGGYRILGYPICMKSPRYDRNEFIFNFCLVVAEDEDFSKYTSIIQKLADLMHGLEEQSGFLSRDHSKSGEGKLYSLCETLMEDLNNYSECMIPIDELNTLNFKLFPVYPAPPHVKAWEVPLFTVRFETFMDENWDLTLQRIIPYINGVNSVRIISILADVEMRLAYKAIRHLLYYGCVFLLDIFSFAAIYAPTAQFSSTIACDEGMQQECARYINTRFAPAHPKLAPAPPPPPGTSSHSRAELSNSHGGGFLLDTDDIWPVIRDADNTTDEPDQPRRKCLDGVGIVELYASLKQGQSVKQWYSLHSRQLANVDVRRFITFGIIKGFLYRVHKYPYGPRPEAFKSLNPKMSTASTASIKWALAPSTSSSVGTGDTDGPPSKENSIRLDQSDLVQQIPPQPQLQSGDEALDDQGGISTSFRSNGNSNIIPTRPESTAATSYEEEEDVENERIDKLLEKYLDGQHCFDEICTELELSEHDLTARLKRVPWSVHIIHR